MREADPTLSRQLSADNPLVLWRDRAGGGREGLVLALTACANPGCDCAEVQVEGWRVPQTLQWVVARDSTVRFRFRDGLHKSPAVLFATVDVGTGSVRPARDAAPTDKAALEWVRRELDPELLGVLKEFRARGKAPQPPALDWRDADWSWWGPRQRVAWFDIHEGGSQEELVVEGECYVTADTYCAVPGCTCSLVEVFFRHEHPTTQDLADVGAVWLDPAHPEARQLHAHGPALARLELLWHRWTQSHDVPALLSRRREELRRLAPEIHRLFAATPADAPRASRAEVSRNGPCPCGSGKKHKKCCGAS